MCIAPPLCTRTKHRYTQSWPLGLQKWSLSVVASSQGTSCIFQGPPGRTCRFYATGPSMKLLLMPHGRQSPGRQLPGCLTQLIDITLLNSWWNVVCCNGVGDYCTHMNWFFSGGFPITVCCNWDSSSAGRTIWMVLRLFPCVSSRRQLQWYSYAAMLLIGLRQ